MNYTVKYMDSDKLLIIYLYISTILAILLIVSELMAWSNCKANGITQIHRSLGCCTPMEQAEGTELV